jgi:hypothetical protein
LTFPRCLLGHICVFVCRAHDVFARLRMNVCICFCTCACVFIVLPCIGKECVLTLRWM